MPSATTAPRRRPARAAKDPVLTGAVELARVAAEETALPGEVGEHLDATVDGERLVTHRFAATMPGYVGWYWAVTVARPPRGRTATVCEVELLPGDGALLAPAWVPWAERLQPGDVGPTDAVPFVADDPRLEQGYEATGDEDADQLAIWELGLGRPRVLSREGRQEAFTRWYDGDHGPQAPSAKAAAAPCSTCGFFMKMAGSARRVFGVCANEWSPDDGRVVSVDHGCGAHSETDVPRQVSDWNPSRPVIDEMDLEVVKLAPARSETPAEAAPADEAAPVAEQNAAPTAEDTAPAAEQDAAPEDRPAE